MGADLEDGKMTFPTTHLNEKVVAKDAKRYFKELIKNTKMRRKIKELEKCKELQDDRGDDSGKYEGDLYNLERKQNE